MSLDLNFLAKSVNFHGHDLLKKVVNLKPNEIGSLNPHDLSFNTFYARVEEIEFLGKSHADEIIEFISDKVEKLWTNQSSWMKTEQERNDLYSERCNHQLPYEYFLKVPPEIRINRFYECVKVGDTLYGEVCNYLPTLTMLNLISFAEGHHRYFSEKEIQICMKNEDTRVPFRDQDRYGNWLIGTKLCVEVLSVPHSFTTDIEGRRVFVGTNGVTMSQKAGSSNAVLGRVSSSNIPICLRESPDSSVKYLSENLENLPSYKNPRSIKQITAAWNIDLKRYPTLFSTLREEYPESQKALFLRKAQKCKWAHKNVADGVISFKKGQYERAFHYLNKAIQIDPENVEAFVAKGALLANLGKYEQAIEDFESGLKYKPDHNNAKKYMCETLVELGKQYELEGNFEGAKKCYTKCFKLNQDHTVARDNLRSLLHKLGEKDDITGPKSKLDNFLNEILNMEEEIKEHLYKSGNNEMGFSEQNDASNSFFDSSENPNFHGVKERSLSPFSKKMAQQENLWAPPPNISQNETFFQSNSSSTYKDSPKDSYGNSSTMGAQDIHQSTSKPEHTNEDPEDSSKGCQRKNSKEESHSVVDGDKHDKKRDGKPDRKSSRRRKDSESTNSDYSSGDHRRHKSRKDKKRSHSSRKHRKHGKSHSEKSTDKKTDNIDESNIDKLDAKFRAVYKKLVDIQTENDKLSVDNDAKSDIKDTSEKYENGLKFKMEDNSLCKLPPISSKINVHPVFLNDSDSEDKEEDSVSAMKSNVPDGGTPKWKIKDTSMVGQDGSPPKTGDLKFKTSPFTSPLIRSRSRSLRRSQSRSFRRSRSRSLRRSRSRSFRRLRSRSRRRSRSRSLRRSRSRGRVHYDRNRFRWSRSPRDRHRRKRSVSIDRPRISRSRSRENQFGNRRGFHYRTNYNHHRDLFYSSRRLHRRRSRSRSPVRRRSRSRSRSRRRNRNSRRGNSSPKGGCKDRTDDNDKVGGSHLTSKTEGLEGGSTEDSKKINSIERFGKWIEDADQAKNNVGTEEKGIDVILEPREKTLEEVLSQPPASSNEFVLK